MIVAVTGSSGHLGANVVRELLDHGYSVRALHHPDARLEAVDGLNVERLGVDVLDFENLREALAGSEAVVNLAALISISGGRDGLVMKTNVLGPGNVSQACLDTGVNRLVHVSSIHAFTSPGPGSVMDENAERPGGHDFIYDQSKALGENEIRAAVSEGLNAVILNPTGILGPHDYANSLGGRMLDGFFESRYPAVLDAGFDWVDARDVASAIRMALVKGKAGENYLLPGQWSSMRELADCCAHVSGSRPPRFTLPIRMAQAALPIMNGFSAISGKAPLFTSESLAILRDSCGNISGAKAARELGFRSRPIMETISDVFEWKQHKKQAK